MATSAIHPVDRSASQRECGPATPDLLERYGRYLTGQRSLSQNTRRIYLDDLRAFLTYCRRQDLNLRDMNRQMLRGYVAYLATEGRADGSGGPAGYARVSIVRKLTALRTFYNFLVQQGWFKSTPVPSARSFPVKVEKPLPSFLGRKEAARLLEAADDDTPTGRRDRAILEILYACGVRLAEIEGMNLGDVHRARREILVRGKGNKERWTLYGGPAEAAIDGYLSEGRPHLAAGEHSDDPLFVNRYGGRLSRRSIEKIVSNQAARAGLKDGIHPHTLRHSFASHMLEGDADLRVIQDLLGHSNVSTTQMYTHITKQEARRAYLTFHPMAAAPSVQDRTDKALTNEALTNEAPTNDDDTGAARA